MSLLLLFQGVSSDVTPAVLAVYTVDLKANISPTASLKTNPQPNKSLKSNPTPAKELNSG